MVARRRPGPSRYDAGVFHHRYSAVFLLYVSEREIQPGPFRYAGASVGVCHTGQRAAGLLRSVVSHIAVFMVSSRFRLSKRAPLDFRSHGFYFGGRFLVWVGALARGTWGHYQPFYYFVPVFFYNLAPWSFFSLPIAFFIFRRRHTLSEDGLLFPLVWFMAVFLFFSIALGKRALYILPLYPAFALLLVGWWANCLKDNVKADWLTTSIGYVLALSSLLVVVGIGLFLLGIDVRLPRTTGVVRDLLDVLTPPSLLVWICLAAGGIAALTMVTSVQRKKWQELFVVAAVLATAA